MTTSDIDSIKADIRAAFLTADRPLAGSLHTSEQSDEASTLLEADFADKHDWRTVSPSFIDKAPAGFGSALSFLSPPAFRYFLPAYLIADLDDHLWQANPVFHLTHGITDADRSRSVAVPRDRVRLEECVRRYDMFTDAEAAAIAHYLEHKAATDECQRDDIEQALRNYWRDRGTRQQRRISTERWTIVLPPGVHGGRIDRLDVADLSSMASFAGCIDGNRISIVVTTSAGEGTTLRRELRRIGESFRRPVGDGQSVNVPGARAAQRIDGICDSFDEIGERTVSESMSVVLAARGRELVTVAVIHDADDELDSIVEDIIDSLELPTS